jgi:hypothetical protein
MYRLDVSVISPAYVLLDGPQGVPVRSQRSRGLRAASAPSSRRRARRVWLRAARHGTRRTGECARDRCAHPGRWRARRTWSYDPSPPDLSLLRGRNSLSTSLSIEMCSRSRIARSLAREPPGEAEQQQRAVPHVPGGVAERVGLELLPVGAVGFTRGPCPRLLNELECTSL